MIFNVKRLQVLENLILETDLIQIGAGIDDAMDKSSSESEEDQISAFEYLDKILDWLFALGADDLNKKLKDPVLAKTFGNKDFRTAMDRYFNYLTNRINELKDQLKTELSKKPANSVKAAQIQEKILMFSSRVEVLDKIYQNLKEEVEDEFVNDIHEKIQQIKEEIVRDFTLPVVIVSDKVKDAFAEYEEVDTPEKKAEKAEVLFTEIQNAKDVTGMYSEEADQALTEVEDHYTAEVEKDLGKEKVAEIKSGVFVTKNVASLLRRIFEFQYTQWTTVEDIETEAKDIRSSINTYPDISTEGKAYLYALVDRIQSALIERAKSKEFDTKKFKGIHYDFKKKMPLYQRTALPVTGKQIADDSKLMKFRKASQDLMNLLFVPHTASGEQAQAFARTGAWLNTIYSKTLNKTAKVVGKAVGGREGEMKADALSRMFIFDTSIVDEPAPKAIPEDLGGGVAPGVSPQVPGSIGSMGPITPPTPTSLGSGDNFSAVGTFGKKKKKSSAKVLGFADFIKEQNNQ